MKGQLQFECINDLPKVKSDAYKKRKWAKALQAYCDKQALEVGDAIGYCMCGHMNYCNFCDGSDLPNACVKSIRELAKKRHVKINYDNYDFEKFIEEIER